MTQQESYYPSNEEPSKNFPILYAVHIFHPPVSSLSSPLPIRPKSQKEKRKFQQEIAEERTKIIPSQQKSISILTQHSQIRRKEEKKLTEVTPFELTSDRHGT